MSEKDNKYVQVRQRDLYQFLISENRYGFTRNNHLMPRGSFDHCKEYLPLMLKADRESALHTALQLCDECISELSVRFYRGIDDENHNMQEYRDFIQWCLDFLKNNGEQKLPLNIDSYYRHLDFDDLPRYKVVDLDLGVDISDPLSLKEAKDLVFDSLGNSKEATYHLQEKRPEEGKIDYYYSFITPHTKKFAIIMVGE